ncbi:MAG: hypothetical protein IIV64_04630 [Muribaculaceae bacterium]|nr:hypothetical protein [Muribaculaceae bacterium]MBQ1185303.1 hypothetical protein [Muribaculaceae bacterium]MBQ2371097.1 hypothetical protein [Muribaculaceae bacterium]MBQ5723464.1 hypothetical protein [Muribaculaceae bacterium]MBR4886417.1 hypothetical protein [Muribaculaceae bacterium]
MTGWQKFKQTPFCNYFSKSRLNGAVQTEFLIPFEDEAIGTGTYDSPVLNNTYFDLTFNAPYLSVGARLQVTEWPLPGFENDFKGWGVPYIWATGSYKWAQLTVGDFYQQFGSGLVLRSYEERSLGIDNAIRGGRLKLNPIDGLSFTALGGKQRRYWDWNDSWVWGGDVEWSFNETFRNAFNPKFGWSMGFSYVGKYEGDEDIFTPDMNYKLNLPNKIAAFDVRTKFRIRNFNILAEFATKSSDPNADNGYIYRPGTAALLSATYSSKGFSAFLQAKRSDNMSFRSKRSMVGVSSFINHMPAFTTTQTYALAAMYPYATQPDGEWAFQGEVRYNFKRKTPLGGRYGTQVRVSGSYIAGLNRNYPDPSNPVNVIGSDGAGAAFWEMGQTFYADANIEINKKLTKNLSLTLFYLYQNYNQAVVEGHGHNGDMVKSNIFVLEGQWKMSKKCQLRWEMQYLQTKQDRGDWIAGLVELSVAPDWMFTITDTYNIGETNLNYYSALVTYTYKANRFQVGYGRTRAGYNCSGGVCRWVPASKGFTIAYNYNF